MSNFKYATPEDLCEMDADTIDKYCTSLYAISLEGMNTNELVEFLAAVQDVRTELTYRMRVINSKIEELQ